MLAKLDRVKRVGPGKWTARCPAHEDKAPSLSIREMDDGRVLLHDWAGCSTVAVIAALGLRWSELMPPLPEGVHHRPPVRRAWSINDALELIDAEATLLTVIIADAVKRGALTAEVADRALKATGRLSHVIEVLRA